MDSFNLIDLRLVGFASLWIVGLAIILSAFGFVHFYAHAESRRSVEIIKRPIHQAVIYTGLMLICFGLSGNSEHWWESILWIILATGFGIFMISAWREFRQSK